MLFDYNKFLIEKEFSSYARFILLNEPQDKDLFSQKEVKFEFNPKFCIITENGYDSLKKSFELQTYNNFDIAFLENLQLKDCDYYVIAKVFPSKAYLRFMV